GKGFYYIPGSDMCLSITGFTRFQVYAFQGGDGTAVAGNGVGAQAFGYNAYSLTRGPVSATNSDKTRRGHKKDLGYRTRVMMTLDARSQTAYGTLRSVITAGFTNDISTSSPTAGTTIYANRGFIQLAGFTFGKATSYYDSYSVPAYSYYGL